MSQLVLSIFSSITLLSSFFFFTVINPVISVMFLVLVFLGVSGIFFLLQIEFIALVFIIVYVGAIAILFLFVVMMLDIKIASKANDFFKYFPLGGIFGSLFLLKVLRIFLLDFSTPFSTSYNKNFSWVTCFDKIANVELIGQVLYGNFFMYFLISGLLLLVAMIGSIERRLV